jgi:hypothetical protein
MAVASSSSTPGRILFTLMGSAGMVVAAFMEWVGGLKGTHLSFHALYQQPFISTSALPLSAGFVVMALGIVAVIGLATSGWLTRLAGALAIVLFILLMIQLYQTGGAVRLPGPGPWLVLGAGIIAVVGGGD